MISGRLVIDGYDIDISENIPFPLTYRISDVKEPDKRKRNKSKTIKIPGTRNNNKFFQSAWNVSISDTSGSAIAGLDFDPSQRSEAQYYRSGELIFDGLAQLLSVKKDGDAYMFDISLFSNFIDLFTAIGSISVSDLGWSEYDHDLNRTNIKNSWDTSVIVDGVATSNFTGSVPDGFGYVYPTIDWGYASVLGTLSTTDLVPLVYWREVMTKIFEFSGLSFSSDLFDTDTYKKLLFGFEGGKKTQVSAAEITARASSLAGDFDYNESTNPTIQYFDFTGNEYYKVNYGYTSYLPITNFLSSVTLSQGSYNPTNTTSYNYIVPKKGNYKVQLSGVLNIDFDLSDGTPPADVIRLTNQLKVYIKRNGAVVYDETVDFVYGSVLAYSMNIENDFNFNQSDIISIEFEVRTGLSYTTTTQPTSPPTLDLSINDNGSGIDFDITSINGTLTDGDTVQISRFLPNMKCSEFLKANITAFNLYFSEPDENGVITIEPLEEFYSATTDSDDWTELLDKSKEIEIVPSSSLIKGKTYAFKFKEDKDYYNTLYRDEYGIGYGDYNYEVESTFQTGILEYKLPFAQAVPVEVETGYVMPRIIKYDEIQNIVSPYKGSPHVFVYNGLQPYNWRLYNDSDSANFEDLTHYPQVNHLEDLDNAVFDLNFGVPEIIYWTALAYTNNNLFKKHEKFTREITSRDAKIMTAYFKLGSKEIKQDFGRLVMINGVLFRKNEIKDFDGIAIKTTKVELLRVLEGDSPEILVVTEAGGVVQNPGGTLGSVSSGGQDSSGSGQATGVSSGGTNSTNEASIKSMTL